MFAARQLLGTRPSTDVLEACIAGQWDQPCIHDALVLGIRDVYGPLAQMLDVSYTVVKNECVVSYVEWWKVCLAVLSAMHEGNDISMAHLERTANGQTPCHGKVTTQRMPCRHGQ
jgi:hypothetical protein